MCRGAPICSVWSTLIIIVTLTNVYAEQRERFSLFEITRLIQFVLVMVSVYIYYEGSNVINRYRFSQRGEAMLYDEALLQLGHHPARVAVPQGSAGAVPGHGAQFRRHLLLRKMLRRVVSNIVHIILLLVRASMIAMND